jgi:hypothetical protein
VVETARFPCARRRSLFLSSAHTHQQFYFKLKTNTVAPKSSNAGGIIKQENLKTGYVGT